MKLSKERRRNRAAARFKLMTKAEWMAAAVRRSKPASTCGPVVGYAQYKERKKAEARALEILP